ncbi:MAG: hypothetical protein GY771_11755 [bacterium]|nr:hypothetical protein [bacterium]
MAKQVKYFAEILASSVHRVSGECYALEDLPTYGQPVVAEADPLILALISELRIGSALPGRSLGRRGLDPDELMQQHPEMGELISTEFEAVVIGELPGGVVSLRSPPRPVPLYTRIRPATNAEMVSLTLAENLTVRLLRASGSDDSFLIAAITHLADTVEDKEGFVADTARYLAAQFTEDFPRLEYIIKELKDLTE